MIVLYFMNEARRDIVLQRPRHYKHWSRGRVSSRLRSPARPNPIALSGGAARIHGRAIPCACVAS